MEVPLPTSNKKNVLKIRCSDGRSRKPDDIRGNFIHQIRLPGGILFPDLCAQQFAHPLKRAVVSKLLRRAQLFAIDVMVKLKEPEAIYIMSHQNCGAAEAIGVPDADVKAQHAAFAAVLRSRYPQIPVIALHERHSICGEHHDGYEEISSAA